MEARGCCRREKLVVCSVPCGLESRRRKKVVHCSAGDDLACKPISCGYYQFPGIPRCLLSSGPASVRYSAPPLPLSPSPRKFSPHWRNAGTLRHALAHTLRTALSQARTEPSSTPGPKSYWSSLVDRSHPLFFPPTFPPSSFSFILSSYIIRLGFFSVIPSPDSLMSTRFTLSLHSEINRTFVSLAAVLVQREPTAASTASALAQPPSAAV